MFTKSPCGSKIPLHRHGSLLLMKPTLQLRDRVGFEAVCVTFHEQFKPMTFGPTSSENTPNHVAARTVNQEIIMLTDGTLILPERGSLGITNARGRTCSHPKELQTDHLSLRRLLNFENPLRLLKTRLNKRLKMTGELLMSQTVHLTSFGKAEPSSL